MYEVLRPYMDIAIANAKRLDKQNEGRKPSESAPGTKVYELVEMLKPYLLDTQWLWRWKGGPRNMSDVLDKVENRGIEKGIVKGESRGENKMALLVKKLLDQNRIDDVKRASEDEKSRAELMEELGINWKIENRDVSLFPTLCNFGTRLGCDQEPPQVIAWGLEKARIKHNEPPRFPKEEAGAVFCAHGGADEKTQYEYIQYKNEYMLKFRENTCIFIKMGVL